MPSIPLTIFMSVGRGLATITVRRACTHQRGCASGPLTSWSETAKAGARSFTLTRRTGGRTLSAGRYTLTVATSGGAKTVSFRVR